MIVEQGSRGKRRYVSLFVAIGLFVLSSSTAFATDFTVTTATDSIGVCPSATTCSLRSAIIAANLNPDPDRIILASSQTYTLSLPGGPLVITEALTIDGNGSTVDAAGLYRVFDIQGDALALLAVTINDLTIKGGSATGFLSFGGGINIRNAQLVLNHCTVKDNVTTLDGI